VETIETALRLADLESVEKAIPRLDKVVRTDPRSNERWEFEVIQRAQGALQEGNPIRDLGLTVEELGAVRSYNFLTLKPVLYVANVAEEDASTGGAVLPSLIEQQGEERVLAVSAQIEAEIAQLPIDEGEEFLSELGLAKTGIERLIQAGYRLLDLITFYTNVNGKLQGWQLPRQTAAPTAAGRIHSDMEEGFIRAEVVSSEELVAAGSLGKLRDGGKLHTHGRDYLIEDGDVVQFLFRN